MSLRATLRAAFLTLLATTALAARPDGNRLAYLDDPSNPYYVGLNFPKLTTPQWVGEEGVEAVVVLAIDDMRDPAPYEAFLRPILDRLKAIDGRAPVSIMTCQVNPKHPRLQSWLKEGLSLEVHTLAHPCPLLLNSDFTAASKTYHGCVDLMNQIPNNRPVAFRMPCCDSKNTVSPRFFMEVFNRTSGQNNHLGIDSSVFQIFTSDDPSLPRDLVQDRDGRERFRKYLPFPSFVNTIENYPYPYVIGRLCWEFPCMVPSDWEAQNLHRAANPKTVEDWKASLDAVVLKQGVFNLVFHPYHWVEPSQVVELIDYAVQKHGKKVKFLTFREAQERIDKNLLGGQSLRREDGRDNGVRLLDLNNDGFMDVVIGNKAKSETRVWEPKSGQWKIGALPTAVTDRLHFGVVRPDGYATMIKSGAPLEGGRDFDGAAWVERPRLVAEVGRPDFQPLGYGSGDYAIRLHDLDGDSRCELIISDHLGINTIHSWSADGDGWKKLPFKLPYNISWVGPPRRLNEGDRVVIEAFGGPSPRPGENVRVASGVVSSPGAEYRLIDLDQDGRDDLIFSNDSIYGIYLFESMKDGWSRKLMAGKAGEPNALPKIVRGRTNNGFWVHSRHLWWQNEDTAKLPDLVDRRSFNELLKGVEPRAKSPEASRDSIRVRTGFKVELVAQEPLVKDPIAFEWGADGRLWVVEMGDYPLGTDGKGKPGGVVRVLEDVDGDGRYDKSTTFLDGLAFPTAVIPWRDGVIVGCAPDIVYAEDRDGDGKADHREVLFTGFGQGNQQHRHNSFELGLDGWVYGANGDSGGKVRSVKTGKVVNIQGRDFRFRPDTGAFEAESGQTQYGRHRDDWGRWFGNNNSVWAWQYVLSDADLRRNARFAPPDPRRHLEPDTRLYPVSRTLPRFNDPGAANRVTSANSPTPYRDDLFGPHFADSLFVSEPVHNLVHRMRLEPDGPTLRGHRDPDEADREFLASADHWFRPTMLKTGPDGALYIADMYRAVIEHPEWIPDDWEKRLDLRAGSEQGRIYRVFPVDRRPRPIPKLDRLDTAGLVAALESPNGWQRDTAQRLLLHRRDPSAVEPLRRLAAHTDRPKTRIQALWTLAGLGELTSESVAAALKDPHPQVRRNALQMSADLLRRGDPALVAAVLRRVDDPDPQVRLQLALSLGDSTDPRAGRALATLIRSEPENPWLRAAVLSSAPPHVGELLAGLFAGEGAPPPAVVEPLFVLAGTGPERGLSPLIRVLAAPAGQGGRFAPWQFSALAGLLDAADREHRPLSAEQARPLAAIRDAARRLAGDDQAPEDERIAALRVLGRDAARRDEDRDRLARLLRPQVSDRLQRAALTALGRAPDEKVPDLLLAGWKGYSPALRDAVLDTLLSRERWTAALLFSLEDRCTPPAEIGPAHRRRLLDQRNPELKKRAEAVFAQASGSRQAVVDTYRPALKLTGDREAGAAVFRKVCATCHRLGGEGTDVGPDLAALADKAPESLLVAILDPNRAFEARYANFNVATTDGRVLSGLIASETATAVTLRRQEGKEDVLLRADIDGLTATGQSLMPEGLENDLKPQDLADLIAYLAATGPPPKRVEGNRPERVRQGADGTVVLKAESAAIWGDSLTLESKYRNLGFWSAANDRASWTFDVNRGGAFAVVLDRACADDTAGNPLVLEVNGQRITYRVTGTGTWDQYRKAEVGRVTLPPGTYRLEVRPDGPIRGALIDLRAVELRPARQAQGDPCCDP